MRCYVASAGREFAILKVAIPTGSFTVQNYNGASYDWTCPRLITKIKCTSAGEWDKYVNVTPGTVYTFMCVKSFKEHKWVIYVGGMILFLCLAEMTRLSFGGHKRSIIHEQDRVMR